jgi:hypothetical protein
MKNQTEPLEHASVRQYCKAVRMPAIGANFVSLAEQAVLNGILGSVLGGVDSDCLDGLFPIFEFVKVLD